jgi:hypothetical protein
VTLTTPLSRRSHSFSGGTVFLCGAVIYAFSRIQKCVTLSVTEAESVAAGLQVTLPMEIETDNKGAKDLADEWTANSKTRHIATRVNFLRELKEENILVVKWISNKYMSSDIFTKNVGGEDFKRLRDMYIRKNPGVSYNHAHGDSLIVSVGEGVGPLRTVSIDNGVRGKKRKGPL